MFAENGAERAIKRGASDETVELSFDTPPKRIIRTRRGGRGREPEKVR